MRSSPPVPPPAFQPASSLPLRSRGLALPCADLSYERWRASLPSLAQLLAPARNALLRTLLLETRWSAGLRCPRCGSERVVRWGASPTGPRFRCRGECGRTFGLTTHTPLAYTKRLAHWPMAVQAMVAGASVRATARVARVHPATAFRWRHRLLAAFAQREQSVRLGGIVEVTELFVRCTMKGPRRAHEPAAAPPVVPGSPGWPGESQATQLCVLLVRDRRERMLAAPVSVGRPLAQDIRRALVPRVRAGSELCAPVGFAYRTSCRTSGWSLRTIRGVPRELAPLRHRENVRTMSVGYRRWVRRFRGTRARYLENYLHWFVAVVRTKAMVRAGAAERLLLAACR